MRIRWRVVTLFILWTVPSLAWWDVGHEVVGEIAWRNLDKKTQIKVQELLKQLAPIYDQASSLASVSKLPDHMRTGFKIFDSWHYIELPDAKMSVQPQATATPNIVWALCECVRNLSVSNFETKSSNPFAFKPKPFEQAFMLPFLAHLVGDIHQPLHALNRYTPMSPHGNEGGNRFLIRVNGKPTNLHRYWDTGVGAFDDVHDAYAPIAGITPRTIELADGVMKQFPKSHFGRKIEEVVFRAWAEESHELAKKVGYNLLEGSEPTEAYVKKGRELSRERVALAGYRLAYILTQALDKNARLLTGCN